MPSIVRRDLAAENQKESSMNRKTLIAAVIGLALLAAFPLMSGNSYYVHMVGTIMIYAILLFGLDIVVGYTGQVFGPCRPVRCRLHRRCAVHEAGRAAVGHSGQHCGDAAFERCGAASAAVTGPYLAMVTLALAPSSRF
jgi:hypothetical protein